MNANALSVPWLSCWLSLIAACLTAGCQQPYTHSPYQQGMYYGQPVPQGMPYGQPMAPTQYAPGVSSVPAENYYTPMPSNGSDAPAFGKPSAQPPASSSNNNSGGNNTVPRYNDPTNSDSPFFEGSSLQQESQVPGTAFVPQTSRLTADSSDRLRSPAVTSMTAVEPANFDAEDMAASEPQIEQTAGEEFEPPVETPAAAGLFEPQPPVETAATSSEEVTPQEPQPMKDPFELAAPPVDTPPTASGDALEGVVRYQQASNSWVMEFPGAAAGGGPFGGPLPLTGKPELLNSLQNGQSYRLQGFIEMGDGAKIKTRFHVQQAQPATAASPVQSPFSSSQP